MENKNIAQGFIVGSTIHPYFMIQREFKRNSKLKLYLNKKFPTEVKMDQTEYTMLKLLELIENIIINEQLYDRTNPYIILCDVDLGMALNVHATHLAETYEYVERQLKPTQIPNNIKKYKGIESSEHLTTLQNPKWTSTEATAIQAFKTDPTYLSVHQRFKPKQKLKKFMTEERKRKPTDIYTVIEIIKEIVEYIGQHELEMIHAPNPKLFLIKDTPLGNALEVNSFDMLQLVHLTKHQLEEEKKNFPDDLQDVVKSVAETLTARVRANNDENHYVATVTITTTGGPIPDDSYTTSIDIN